VKRQVKPVNDSPEARNNLEILRAPSPACFGASV